MPNTNYSFAGVTVEFLTDAVVLKGSDYVRGLVESGSEGGFDTTYKPSGWRGLAWHKVEQELPGWVGKTYADYMQHCGINQKTHELIRVLP